MSNKATGFIEWLDELEKARGYTDYEVAKQGGFSHSVISRARSGVAPGWDVCAKIADVFHVSPITVFRKAGLLPQGPEGEVVLEDWKYLLSKLTPEEAEEVREIAERKIRRHQEDNSLKSLKPKKAGR